LPNRWQNWLFTCCFFQVKFSTFRRSKLDTVSQEKGDKEAYELVKEKERKGKEGGEK